MNNVTSTRQGDAVARRVTISLACKSKSFADIAGESGVYAIQKVRRNEWSYEGLTKRQIMAVDEALEKADEQLGRDFIFTGHVYALNECSGTCELCGQEHVKFLFQLNDKHTGNTAFESVGSSCIYTYLYHALGVATAEEAKSVLDGYINDLIRLQDAVAQHKEHPTLGSDLKQMHEDMTCYLRVVGWKDERRAAAEMDRALRGKHGYIAQADRVRRVATTALRNASKHLPETDSFIQELKYAIDNEVGFVSPKRLEQVTVEWPKLVADMKQRYDFKMAERERYERDRKQRELKACQETIRKTLETRQDYMTAEEREIIEDALSCNVNLFSLPYDDARRTTFDNVRYRSKPVKDQPVVNTSTTPADPEQAKIQKILEDAEAKLDKYSAEFASSLLRQFKRTQVLTERQLAFVIGDDTGMAPNGKPSLRKKVEDTLAAVSA